MKKKNKIIIAILILLLVIVAGAVLYIQTQLPEKITILLEKELSKQLNTDDQDLYYVEIEQIQFSLTSPQFKIPRISVTPKEHVFSDTLPENLPPFLFKVTLHNFGISANGVFAAIRKRKDIVFNQVEISVTNFTLFGNPESREENKDTDTIPAEGSYGISNLQIWVDHFTYKPLSDTTTITAETVDFDFVGSIIRKVSAGEKKPDWFIENYMLRVASINYFPEDELYSYHTENLVASSDDEILSLMSTAIKPKYGKKEFQNHLKYQIERMDVLIDTITLTGFDPNPVINQSKMILSGLSINNAHLEAFRDRNLPFDTLRRPLMPAKRMHKSPVLFFVPEIDLHNVDVIYSELPINGTEEGFVPITNINATISNFTNIPDSLQKDSIMQIVAEGRFFQQARLNATFDYNLQDLNGGYSARGELSELEFAKLNVVLMPLVKVEVEDGVHNHTAFAFSGNDTRSTGKITMLYTDLNVILEKDRSRIRRSIVGWAGRNFIYYPSNPVKDDPVREGAIEFERDQTRFVFHYWWNCYLSGIKNTVIRDKINI